MTPDEIKQKHAATIEVMLKSDQRPYVKWLTVNASILRSLADNYGIDYDRLLSLDEVLTQVAAKIAASKPITPEDIEKMKWRYNLLVAPNDVDAHNACLDAIIARLPKTP